MASFADINVSQGSLAAYARCGGIFNIHFITNLPRNLPVIFFKSVKFDRVCGPTFMAHPIRHCVIAAVRSERIFISEKMNAIYSMICRLSIFRTFPGVYF